MSEHKEIAYKILHEPVPEIKALLTDTIYGTTGLRYSHIDAAEKVNHLDVPDFHTLWQDNELVALAVYCNRQIFSGGKSYNSYYIRYFAVKPGHQGKGLGKLITRKLEEYYRARVTKQTIYYAYIEGKNARSLGVSKNFEQERLGQFKTVLLSRFFPKKKEGFRRATSSDKVAGLLAEFYKGHSQFHQNKIGFADGYFVMEKEGEIVAGVQAFPIQWRLHHIPGAMGWLSRNILHFLPIIGRQCPRNELKYVALEGIYIKDGHDSALIELVESCMAHYNMYASFTYIDLADPMYHRLKSRTDLGLMNKLQSPPAVHFTANFLHFSDEEKKSFYNQPKYLSAFDLT